MGAEAAVSQQPAGDRFAVWLATFVGSFVLGLALEAPQWIPGWQLFVDGLGVCLLVSATVAGIASFKAARRRIYNRVSSRWRWLVYPCLAAPMFAVWSFGALILAFAVSGGPFGATYSKQFHFAEVDATIYLYDSSFLDPATTVYLRRGWLPLREQVMILGEAPDDVEVVLRGNVLTVEDRAVDLRKRE